MTEMSLSQLLHHFKIQGRSRRIILNPFRMILEDTPLVEGITTVHFPDVQANYFRLLLDFLYSGQTYVPANEVDYLHELLALLQIKPNVWRSGNKKDSGK